MEGRGGYGIGMVKVCGKGRRKIEADGGACVMRMKSMVAVHARGCSKEMDLPNDDLGKAHDERRL